MKNVLIILKLIFLFIFFKCAHMELPSGGPQDKTPPHLTGVFPAPGSVNVSRDLDVTLEFSEWISSAWVKNPSVSEITISPALARKLKFSIKGNKIQITSNSKLAPSTTYILSVNNSLKDLNNQRLKANFYLVFSTGPRLDSGIVSGVLDNSGGSTEKLWLGLYPIGESRLDLAHLNTPYLDSPGLFPDPAKERPMYLIKTDSSGKFSYGGIKRDRYAVLGFEESNTNLKPDIVSEKLAIGDTLHIDELSNLSLGLSLYQQVNLKIVSAIWRGYERDTLNNLVRGVLTVEVNQPVKWNEKMVKESLEITTGDSTGKLTISGFHAHDLPGSKKIELLVNGLSPDLEYRISMQGISDIFSNPLDSVGHEMLFKGGPEVDTSRVSLVIKMPPRKDTSVILTGPLLLNSNRPLALEDIKKGEIYLEMDEKLIKTTLEQRDFRTLALKFPVEKYSAQKIVIRQKSAEQAPLSDTASDTLARSPDLILTEFTLADEENWGSLEFIQQDKKISWTVILSKIPGKIEKKHEISTPESFILDSLRAGKYLIRYYHDKNKNGTWDAGSLEPWQSQEMQFIPQDTVVIHPSEKSSIQLGLNPG